MATARASAYRAYCPHSKFRVGAAVVDSAGKIYCGANIENDCYGLGTCAERVALAAAKFATDLPLIAIGIVCIDAPDLSDLSLTSPCGACRQWIKQLAPQAEIFIGNESTSFRISDLLPFAFNLGESR